MGKAPLALRQSSLLSPLGAPTRSAIQTPSEFPVVLLLLISSLFFRLQVCNGTLCLWLFLLPLQFLVSSALSTLIFLVISLALGCLNNCFDSSVFPLYFSHPLVL